jgi:hypothetical protein
MLLLLSLVPLLLHHGHRRCWLMLIDESLWLDLDVLGGGRLAYFIAEIPAVRLLRDGVSSASAAISASGLCRIGHSSASFG